VLGVIKEAMKYTRLVPDRIIDVLKLTGRLGAWFDEHARTVSIPIDLKHQIAWVAIEGDSIVGFISGYVAEGRFNIGWIGVSPEFHKKGIGKALIDQAKEYAKNAGINELATYTLGPDVDYPPYELTRKFYQKIGFTEFRRASTNNAGCPQEISLHLMCDDA
jgi:ribosomal protein S18 acetylase RimI-like enzyme